MMKSNLKRVVLALMFCGMFGFVEAQQLKSFVIFNGKGEKVDFGTMIKTLSAKDIVLLGENHNCSMAHWIYYKTVETLSKQYKDDCSVGFEMLEDDNQIILDEYANEVISESSYEKEMRLWGNYSTDYAFVVDYAKEHKLPIVATNIPRRYANFVLYNSLDSLKNLSDEAKSYMPPLPIPYDKAMDNDPTLSIMKSMMNIKSNGAQKKKYLSQAQALKDATMAWNIVRNFKHHFIHLNGRYHSDLYGGIYPYIKILNKNLTIGTVSTTRVEQLDKLDEAYLGLADFIIAVPEDMIFSY